MPPGLAFISVSEEAWSIQKECKTPRFYFDLLKHQESLKKGQTPWTPALSLFYQLELALNKLKSELKDNKLPEGTYFYIIKLNNGCPDYKGYLYLRRRN